MIIEILTGYFVISAPLSVMIYRSNMFNINISQEKRSKKGFQVFAGSFLLLVAPIIAVIIILNTLKWTAKALMMAVYLHRAKRLRTKILRCAKSVGKSTEKYQKIYCELGLDKKGKEHE